MLWTEQACKAESSLCQGRGWLWLQANWLRSQGVGKGDCVSIYMPMICELPIAMVRLLKL